MTAIPSEKHDWTDDIAPETPFEDSCYPPVLVDDINFILNQRHLTAQQMWRLICLEVYDQYDNCDGDGEEFGTQNYHYSLETVPREFLLVIIMRRRIFGYRHLADAFGMVPLKPYK